VLTALAWAVATLSAARASRLIGPWSTTAGVVSVGLVASIPLVLVERPPGPDDAGDLALLAFAGIGYVIGMVCNYAALGRGKVGLVAPITSAEGAIAALLAVAAGEPATPLLLVLLGGVVAGIVVTTLEPGIGPGSFLTGDRTYLVFATAAALLFGASLFAAGYASESVPLGWVVIAGRIAGVLGVALPLVLLGRLRMVRAAVPFVVLSGLLEVSGYLTFAWGARDGIAVTAVLASQFAVLAAVGAHLLGERLAPRQWAGVGVVAIGVAAITLLRV
jgi:drug/metabolite transporter (DMT)-like permease